MSRLKVDNLIFQYEEKGKRVLDNINFLYLLH